MTTTPNEDQVANVRYLVDDVAAAIDFYTAHLGFTVHTNAVPAFADVIRGPLRLLLSGPASSGARATPGDFTNAGRNRIHLIVTDLDAETTGCAKPGYLSAAMSSPAPADAKSCSPTLPATSSNCSNPRDAEGLRARGQRAAGTSEQSTTRPAASWTFDLECAPGCRLIT